MREQHENTYENYAVEKLFSRSSCIGKIERKFRDDGEHTPVTRVITLSAIRRISSKPRGFWWYRVTTIKITNCSKMIRQNIYIYKSSHQDRSTAKIEMELFHTFFSQIFNVWINHDQRGKTLIPYDERKYIWRFTCVLPVIHMWKWNARRNFLQWLYTIEHVIEIHSRKNT